MRSGSSPLVFGSAFRTLVSFSSNTGSRRSGNFVAFVPEQSANDFQYLEDGFALMLTNSTWMAIRRALESETSISVPVSKAGLKFSIEWLRATYVSPTDGRVYVAESWRTYGTADPDEKGPVATERFVLLTSDSELADRISIEELGNFMAAVKAVVVNQFVSVPRQPGQDLAIECEIDPGNESTFHLAARPGMDPAAQSFPEVVRLRRQPARAGDRHSARWSCGSSIREQFPDLPDGPGVQRHPRDQRPKHEEDRCRERSRAKVRPADADERSLCLATLLDSHRRRVCQTSSFGISVTVSSQSMH